MPVPPLGRHRALIHADYARLARHLRDRVDGVLDWDDPDLAPGPDVARIEVHAGKPRLWGGPEIEQGPAGIAFVRVCPGTFTMGSRPGDADTPEHLRPDSAELPAHAVILDGFEIARTETTAAQATALAGAVGRAFGAAVGSAPDTPATIIDWNAARAACQEIKPAGDLPSEAQWEYAARGGAQTPYPFPSDLTTLCQYANGAGNEYPYGDWKNKDCSDPYAEAAPVGRFPPNPLGLRDMHGNVWEWVRDCHAEDAYAGRGPHATASPEENGVGCRWRVLRGGSFTDEPRALRSADRLRLGPEDRRDAIGFRCVRGSVRQLVH